VTAVVYGAVTSAHLSPGEFWPLHLYAAEPHFVRLNVSVWVSSTDRSSGGDAAVGLYARRGAFPSHTRYDVFHSLDVDQLTTRTRRRTSNHVSHFKQ